MVLLSRSISQGKIVTLPCFVRRENSKDSEKSGSMRIIDFLSDRDDDDEQEIEGKKGVLDFKFLISRFFSKNSFRILWKRTKKRAGSVSDLDLDSVSDTRASSEEMDVVAVSHSGRKHEDIAFNLGMGVGLVFLLAKNASEFNKMMELRTQMEMILEEIRQEVHRRDAKDSSSGLNDNISVSCAHCYGDINMSKTTSMPNCNDCLVQEEAKYSAESDREPKYATVFANTRSRCIDQMEAELEVELERLQHNLEGEGKSSSLLHHKIEVNCKSNDPSFESFSINNVEDDATKYENNQEFNGVSAHELERKLHELLEARQREQIAELESALELAEKTLREKEMELDWWKEVQWAASFNKEELFISRELEGLTIA